MSRKNFTVKFEDKTVNLSIRQPDHNDLDEANKLYSSKIASLIRQNGKQKLLVRSAVNDFLRENGIWTDQDEKKVDSINRDINNLLTKLRQGGIKLSQGRDIAIQITDKRKEILGIMNKRRIFDESTIENIAEREKEDYLIYVCTVYEENGERYWESFEDMKNDKFSKVFQEAVSASMETLYGVDDKFETRLPENRWLKKYGFVNDELQYIDRKTQELVDRHGKPIKEIIEESQKAIDDLQGEIKEEQPFVDDETNEPVVTT